MSELNGTPEELRGAAAAHERRAAERHPCNLQPFWSEWGAGRGDSAMASVHNISTTGISLVTRSRVKPGSVLVIKLLSEKSGLTRPLLVRVMHSTLRPEVRVPGEEEWLVGCAFVRRLTEENLQALLRESNSG